MDFYRVFVWDGTSQGDKVLKNFYPPRLKQGAGRHDIPERDGVIYCSKSSISAIAELALYHVLGDLAEPELTHKFT